MRRDQPGAYTAIMPNTENYQMEMKIENNVLTIKVDVSDKAIKAAPMSKSGKNKLIASTGGFQDVDGRVRVGLNVTAK
jgi:hypothetical protein